MYKQDSQILIRMVYKLSAYPHAVDSTDRQYSFFDAI